MCRNKTKICKSRLVTFSFVLNNNMNVMINKFLRITLMVLVTSSLCVCCVASPKGDQAKKMLLSQKTDGYGKVMNDSIASIILEASKIICELQSKNPSDISRRDTVETVPVKFKTVLQFLFFDVDNFKSDDIVYGGFQSWACYKFKSGRNKIVYLEMDFSLRKWRLLDKNKKQICTQDMKENNLLFLRFTRLLFPQDKTLKILNDNLTTTK